MEFDVDEDAALLDVLKIQYPKSSATKLRKMLTQGRVTVNDEVEHRAKETVVKGSKVVVLDRPCSIRQNPAPRRKKSSGY
jgi:ribosome-associated protein YbcJ (S4-like RNA binding protein)